MAYLDDSTNTMKRTVTQLTSVSNAENESPSRKDSPDSISMFSPLKESPKKSENLRMKILKKSYEKSKTAKKPAESHRESGMWKKISKWKVGNRLGKKPEASEEDAGSIENLRALLYQASRGPQANSLANKSVLEEDTPEFVDGLKKKTMAVQKLLKFPCDILTTQTGPSKPNQNLNTLQVPEPCAVSEESNAQLSPPRQRMRRSSVANALFQLNETIQSFFSDSEESKNLKFSADNEKTDPKLRKSSYQPPSVTKSPSVDSEMRRKSELPSYSDESANSNIPLSTMPTIRVENECVERFVFNAQGSPMHKGNSCNRINELPSVIITPENSIILDEPSSSDQIPEVELASPDNDTGIQDEMLVNLVAAGTKKNYERKTFPVPTITVECPTPTYAQGIPMFWYLHNVRILHALSN